MPLTSASLRILAHSIAILVHWLASLENLLPQSFGFIPVPTRSDETSTHPDGGPEDKLLSSNRYERHYFHSAILPDDRSILVYLPARYEEEKNERFPVFYLHDGQNLFDDRTSYVPGSTWRAHLTADELAASGVVRPLILVGIANTGLRRMAEYTPTRDFKMGGGEGADYGRLIVEELKPIIDDRYRTLAGHHNTGLGGSSLGGLISLYLGFKYPDVFGRLAVMSPSLWWDHRSILNLASRMLPRHNLKVWLDMGTAEGAHHLRDADLLYRTLLQRGWRPDVDLTYTRAEGALHCEGAWASRFGDVLRFLFPT